MSLRGAILSDMIKGFVMAEIMARVPESVDFIDWIEMIFTFGLGMTIGKFAQQHEDLISVCATAIMGAYVQLQVVVSMGFPFCQTLSFTAAMDDKFGCASDNIGCNLLLVATILYGCTGTYNQFKMNSVMKAMEVRGNSLLFALARDMCATQLPVA